MAQQPPGPGTPPEQRQPTTQEIIQNMRDSIALINERAKDQLKGIFDNIIQQLAAAAGQLQERAKEIERLQLLLKHNGIDYTPAPPKQSRAEKRRASKAAKKQAKKDKKKKTKK